MPGGDSNLAQAIYLAQLAAQKGDCNCPTCQLLRKVTEEMTAEILGSSRVKQASRKKVKTETLDTLFSPGDVDIE